MAIEFIESTFCKFTPSLTLLSRSFLKNWQFPPRRALMLRTDEKSDRIELYKHAALQRYIYWPWQYQYVLSLHMDAFILKFMVSFFHGFHIHPAGAWQPSRCLADVGPWFGLRPPLPAFVERAWNAGWSGAGPAGAASVSGGETVPETVPG